jgi:aldose sugar dehydrogenase
MRPGTATRTATRTATAPLALTVLAALAVACSPGEDGNPAAPAPPATAAAPTTPQTPSRNSPTPRAPSPAGVPTPRVAGTVVTDLTSPWGLAFLPDRTALVSERDTGRIKQVRRDGSVVTVGTVPGVDPGGEGGMPGIAVPPDFSQRPYVYAYFTAANDNRIVRMPFQRGRLGAPQVIFDGINKAVVHNGGRIVFGPDGMLYAGTGDATERGSSQDRNSPNGKILRMTPEGRPATGNPFRGSVVYSYGHRNVQGLAFDPDGRLWASEFGQHMWDELNLIQPGRNYGWPEVEGRGGDSRFVEPVAQWGTDEASPSGIAIARGAVWMAGLRGARLWRIPINGERAGRPRPFFTDDFGRLRTVEPAPDGSLWLITSNTDGRGFPRRGDDRILRLELR